MQFGLAAFRGGIVPSVTLVLFIDHGVPRYCWIGFRLGSQSICMITDKIGKMESDT